MYLQNIKPSFQLILSVVLLCMAIVFGGGQGTVGDSLTQITALILILVLFRKKPALKEWPRSSLWILMVILPLILYLLPWPDSLRYAGLARADLQQTLTPLIGDIGHQGSLSPIATERALFWLFPACAIYLSLLHSSQRQREMLAGMLVVLVFAGALIGLVQKSAGHESWLYFYTNTNSGSAVGFFANSNHYAISLAASLPLVWAGFGVLFNRRAVMSVTSLWFVAFTGLALLSILGFLLSDSRAGLILGVLGCMLMIPAVIAADRHHGPKRWLFALMTIGLFILLISSLYFISLQFQDDPLSDIRWKFAPIVQHASAQYAPSGSGPGSFWFVFPRYEDYMSGNVIVNHAHNDYLELWLEMRWLFAVPALVLMLAFIRSGVRLWLQSSGSEPESLVLARAAWVGLLLLLLHSIVDYPLRTTALSTMAGLLAAFLVSVESRKIALS